MNTETQKLLPAPDPEIIVEPRWQRPKAILITQTLQDDFTRLLGPQEPLPNLVHIGKSESERLMGQAGSLVAFLKASHAVVPEDLAIIHIVDWHDPVRDRRHLDLYKEHAEANSPGARLVHPIDEIASQRPNTYVVRAGNINDMESSGVAELLSTLLEGRDLSDVAIGVVGVWTDVKVKYLLYELSTRFGATKLATCSSLTASKSRQNHFAALQHLGDTLGVKVFHDANGFLRWLDPAAVIDVGERGPADVHFVKEPATPPSWTPQHLAEREVLLSHMGNGGAALELTALNGGFSGSQALLAVSGGNTDVVKIGPREDIAWERYGNEVIGRILGDVVPRLIAYREGDRLAAMKIELAESGRPGASRPATFQSLAQQDLSEPMTGVLEAALDRTLRHSMGRLYRVGDLDSCDLLETYRFVDEYGQTPFAAHTVANADKVAVDNGFPSAAALLAAEPHNTPFVDIEEFYRKRLPGAHMIREMYSSQTHADLNLVNILLSYDLDEKHLEKLWLIDFARLGKLPVLTDFAKIENDLSYIVLPIRSQEEYERARELQAIRLASPTLELDNFPALAQTPEELRYTRLVQTLRSIAAEIDPRGEAAMEAYRPALLRYAAHTMGFSEPNALQRRLALVGTAQLAAEVSQGLR